MSLALKIKPLPIGNETGKYDRVKNQYKGIKTVTRQWEVVGSSRQYAGNLIEEGKSLFDAYGTKDGETTNTAFNRTPEIKGTVFPDMYLEEQDIASRDPNSSSAILTKIYQEAYLTFREIQKPTTSTDSQGRKTTLRTMVILNSAGQEAIDGVVGTPDEEFPDQVYVKQTAETGNAVTIVKREFLQATDSLEEIGDAKFTLDEFNRRTTERTYIVLSSASRATIEGVLGTADVDDPRQVYVNQVAEDNGVVTTIRRKFVEATTQWEKLIGDKISYSKSGLKQLTRSKISLVGTAYIEKVGVSSITHDSVNLFLSNYEFDESDVTLKVIETWSEAGELSRKIQEKHNGKLRIETVDSFVDIPTTSIGGVKIGEDVSDVSGIPTTRYTFAKGVGQISVSTRPGPSQLPATKYVTVKSLGFPVVPTGVLIAESDTESDGYITYERTSVQGTIEGTKATYTDIASVRVAGTVELKTVEKSAGGISGTIAVVDVKPPRTKKIAATVTIEITKTPPNTGEVAYDLGDIGCSVQYITMSENFRGSDVFETKSGNQRFSGQRKSASMSARITSYPECYLKDGSTASGVFSYTSSWENTSNGTRTIVALGQTSTTRTFLDGSGSTELGENYKTNGVIKRSSRPILTSLAGDVYYEVITWSV